MERLEEQKGEGDFTRQLGSRDSGLQACKECPPDCSPAGFPRFSARETLAVDWKAGRRKKPFCLCFRQRRHPWVAGLRRCRGVSAAEARECRPQRQPRQHQCFQGLHGSQRPRCVQSSHTLPPPDRQFPSVFFPGVGPFSSISFHSQQEPCPGTQSWLASCCVFTSFSSWKQH